jgi:hypothetical protein
MREHSAKREQSGRLRLLSQSALKKCAPDSLHRKHEEMCFALLPSKNFGLGSRPNTTSQPHGVCACRGF